MASGNVFITGASGFIGSAIAINCLKAGYHLRVSLRKEEQIAKIRALLSEYGTDFEFVIVPDITHEDAFTGKLDGVDYVLHLAAPLPYSIPEKGCFDPAVKGTTSILKAALKIPSIKKVLLTSSLAAFLPLSGLPEGAVITECDNRHFDYDESRDLADPYRRYMATKLVADKAASAFRETAQPHYSLITLHPTCVYGHNLVQESPADVWAYTNRHMWEVIMDKCPVSWFGGVHIQDVVDAHLRVLERDIPDGSKYLLAGPSISSKEVKQVMEKLYPHVETSFGEISEHRTLPTDASKAERELGIQWKPLEDMISGIMDQQLALREQAAQG
ncbi:NAD-dependent epimerase/dehydratase [Penicillium capsulatum]|uniref:NAD-dependent epimerase/dehydratase n=1 Tax=Penicillium capsulatum TaxID=69766 RepID=A0A9W9HPF8_9EURO|nr:NAD-dependent epimerase/dehydratase [Penicillium capsulatum]KAJ6112814.1 NAD-dependent epimerase/dehydratase [Penicillium capsulatum]